MNEPDALGFTPSRRGRGSGLTYILEERLDTVARRLSVAKSVVLTFTLTEVTGLRAGISEMMELAHNK